jgi:tetratricopeptide (TPR) repeat protein/transcriptional regulator with XRE-family HTH domain
MGTWTKAGLNRLRERMNTQGWTTDEIAEEIRHQCGCSKLAAYRMAHGWSQPEAAERYTKATGGYMAQPLLSKLEQFPADSDRAPLASHLIGFAAVYATTPLRLIAPKALEQLDPRERDVLIRCNTAFTPTPPPQATMACLDSLGRGETPHTPGPRRVRLATTNLELERQTAMAARKAFQFLTHAEGSNVGPETLDQLRDDIARLAVAYQTQPLPTLLGDLVEVQDVAFRLLEGHQRPNQTRELYLLAGIISGILANASHNLGDPHAAMTQARTAYVCADNAGHDGLRAWVRGQQCVVAYWGGWPHEALRYAQLGAEPAARATGTVTVFLPALAGRAWAALGNSDESRAAIQQAHTARDTVAPDELDEFGGGLTFARPRQLYYAADATGWLPGEEERAGREAAEAVEAYEHADPAEQSYADEAVVRADLALARARLGNLDGARAALQPVLDLPPDRRLSGITAITLRVHTALRDPRYRGSPAARETQQEIEAFCQTTIALPC